MATVGDIKRAVHARREYFVSNNATLTMKQARRLLESDLGIPDRALDVATLKDAVSKYVDTAISGTDSFIATSGASKNKTATDFDYDKENSNANGSDLARKGGLTAEEASSRKDARAGISVGGGGGFKESRVQGQNKAQEKRKKREAVDTDDEESGGEEEEEASDDSDDEAAEKPAASKKTKAKPKPKTIPAQMSTAIIRLRDLCKRAGLTYQHVFMRNKDDASREAALKVILDDHGLSRTSDASAVARVRAQRDKEKDLDGIDTSNVIEGGRRRRAAEQNQWGEGIDYAALNGKNTKKSKENKKHGGGDSGGDSGESEDDDRDDDSDNGDDSSSEERDSDHEEVVMEDASDGDAAGDGDWDGDGVASDEDQDDEIQEVVAVEKESTREAEAGFPEDDKVEEEAEAPAQAVSPAPPAPTPVFTAKEQPPAHKVVRRGGVLYDSDDE